MLRQITSTWAISLIPKKIAATYNIFGREQSIWLGYDPKRSQLEDLIGLIRVSLHLIRLIVIRIGEGYLLEADVRYPKELHDSHNNIPFMCEKMKINRVEKLVPNLTLFRPGGRDPL